MNRIIILLLSSWILYACDNKPSADTKKVHENMETGTHEHESAPARLMLNNGQKWKADSITNSNVRNIQAILGEFISRPDKSLAAYNDLSEELTAAMNKMVSECKMKGSDHDALHLWLEPLMEMIRQLKTATSTQQAAAITSEFRAQLDLYSQYFE